MLLAIASGAAVGLLATAVNTSPQAQTSAANQRTTTTPRLQSAWAVLNCCGLDASSVTVSHVDGRPVVVGHAQHLNYLALLSRLVRTRPGPQIVVIEGGRVVLRARVTDRPGNVHAWVAPKLLRKR